MNNFLSLTKSKVEAEAVLLTLIYCTRLDAAVQAILNSSEHIQYLELFTDTISSPNIANLSNTNERAHCSVSLLPLIANVETLISQRQLVLHNVLEECIHRIKESKLVIDQYAEQNKGVAEELFECGYLDMSNQKRQLYFIQKAISTVLQLVQDSATFITSDPTESSRNFSDQISEILFPKQLTEGSVNNNNALISNSGNRITSTKESNDIADDDNKSNVHTNEFFVKGKRQLDGEQENDIDGNVHEHNDGSTIVVEDNHAQIEDDQQQQQQLILTPRFKKKRRTSSDMDPLQQLERRNSGGDDGGISGGSGSGDSKSLRNEEYHSKTSSTKTLSNENKFFHSSQHSLPHQQSQSPPSSQSSSQSHFVNMMMLRNDTAVKLSQEDKRNSDEAAATASALQNHSSSQKNQIGDDHHTMMLSQPINNFNSPFYNNNLSSSHTSSTTPFNNVEKTTENYIRQEEIAHNLHRDDSSFILPINESYNKNSNDPTASMSATSTRRRESITPHYESPLVDTGIVKSRETSEKSALPDTDASGNNNGGNNNNNSDNEMDASVVENSLHTEVEQPLGNEMFSTAVAATIEKVVSHISSPPSQLIQSSPPPRVTETTNGIESSSHHNAINNGNVLLDDVATSSPTIQTTATATNAIAAITTSSVKSSPTVKSSADSTSTPASSQEIKLSY